MKNILKYFYLLFCSAILLILILFGFLATSTEQIFSFYIQSPDDSGAQQLSVFDNGDGNYYVFLPSYADMSLLTFSIPEQQRVLIDGNAISNGMSCEDLRLDVPYAFQVDDRQPSTLWFYRSENVASLYITTATGSMERIHADKNYEESASVRLYTSDGTLDHADDNSILKGRGNYSWTYDKRPYALKLSSDGDLLDMGAATNWVLLANAFDETNLNNKLIFDLAERTGAQWVPGSRYVDVYLNGEYNGLYLLTEKVEVHENRLDIDAASGDFLCKIDLSERFKTLRNPFTTDAGRTIEINYPEALTPAAAAEIRKLSNQMEQELLSGMDLTNSVMIDLDSWVRRYLIDEISGNIDADLASSYFYYSNGRFYAGPLWDYDMVLGNGYRNQDPNMFIAKNIQRSSIYLSPYNGALYENNAFYDRMVTLYRTEFLPVLQQMVDSRIDVLAHSIRGASRSNSLRWRGLYDELQSWAPGTVHTVDGIKDYLTRRINFLNEVWLDGAVYCTIQFETVLKTPYTCVCVPKGSILETALVDTVNTVWVDTVTGAVFDFSQPVTQDMILTKQNMPVPSSGTDRIVFISLGVLMITLIGLVTVEQTHRRKERRSAEAGKRSKVSS